MEFDYTPLIKSTLELVDGKKIVFSLPIGYNCPKNLMLFVTPEDEVVALNAKIENLEKKAEKETLERINAIRPDEKNDSSRSEEAELKNV